MIDEDLKKMADLYKVNILEENYDEYIMILLRNVEREVRSECAGAAFELANKIANMNKSAHTAS